MTTLKEFINELQELIDTGKASADAEVWARQDEEVLVPATINVDETGEVYIE